MSTFLDNLETLYHETSNPIYAWKAFVEECPVGAPLPGWIEDYFRACGGHLLDMAEAREQWLPEPDLKSRRRWRAVSPGEAGERASQALGLTRVGRNAFEEYRHNHRNAFVASVRDSRPKGGRRPRIKDLAKWYGVKPGSIHHWIRRAKERWNVQ